MSRVIQRIASPTYGRKAAPSPQEQAVRQFFAEPSGRLMYWYGSGTKARGRLLEKNLAKSRLVSLRVKAPLDPRPLAAKLTRLTARSHRPIIVVVEGGTGNEHQAWLQPAGLCRALLPSELLGVMRIGILYLVNAPPAAPEPGATTIDFGSY